MGLPLFLDSLWAGFAGETPTPRATRPTPPRARLSVECLEEREVMAVMGPAVFPDAAASAGAVAVLHRAAKAQTIAGPLRRIGRQLARQLQAQPLQLTNMFVNQAGQLTATGTILGQTVLVPITNLTLTPQQGTSCQVLHL